MAQSREETFLDRELAQITRRLAGLNARLIGYEIALAALIGALDRTGALGAVALGLLGGVEPDFVPASLAPDQQPEVRPRRAAERCGLDLALVAFPRHTLAPARAGARRWPCDHVAAS
jgi:hypothetical protein